MQASDIGLVGLGVMGENLALNLERNGFAVSGFDLDAARRQSFTQRTEGLKAQTTESLAQLVASLQVPRRVWLMVPAGAPVDAVLAELRPLLSAGDVIIASLCLGGALVLFGRAGWPEQNYATVAAATIIASLCYTVFSEWLNIEVRAAWAYRDIMPLVPPFGTGLTPFLQWIIVPGAAFLWAAPRRTKVR